MSAANCMKGFAHSKAVDVFNDLFHPDGFFVWPP